ncbi:hypothetical protein P280DRAFT_414972 [Massarina eburnea CBS 473.64]|uniref:PRISE-like Rossmann-fold domain-containing protein n=1 Tax=Massarina eburnea CBS 473.64 TaxID=1395130 RepID=A0A6A6SIK2_9PLEO|nr:hypothetical protein P280DRAFT_414972 [Massarina eburnea CBS 473.64]
MTNQNHHALVIGASGLIGWSVVNQLLLSYPSPGTFSKITALVNRPLKLEDSFWPNHTPDKPELKLVSGINLVCEDEQFRGKLRENVEDVETITHVFYFAFKENLDAEQEVTLNVGMLRRVVLAVKSLCPKFKFLVYPGGSRGYGIYRPDGVFSAPLVEEMADSLPDDYAKTVSYPHYRAMLAHESAGSDWKWTELCPDAIIGFTPNGSGYSLAGHWAVYLYTYKLVYGEGAEVPFPGVMKGYDSRFTETSSTTLARVAIYAALHPSVFHGRIFNVADSSKAGSMRERWPQVARWFGLKGVPPRDTASATDQKPSQFIKEHEGKLKQAGVKGVDIWNSGQLDSVGYWLTFDRWFSLERLRETGFTEESAPKEGWLEAFEMFRKGGMIA